MNERKDTTRHSSLRMNIGDNFGDLRSKIRDCCQHGLSGLLIIEMWMYITMDRQMGKAVLFTQRQMDPNTGLGILLWAASVG